MCGEGQSLRNLKMILYSDTSTEWVFGRMTQSDWSDGPQPGPVSIWESGFESAQDLSWRSIRGQLSLSATARTTPFQEIIADDAAQALTYFC